MTAIKPKVLDSALERIVTEDAISVSIVEIGFGDKYFPVTGGETEMRSLREKYPVVDARKDGNRRFHVTADLDSDAEYPIHEMGFYGERLLRSGERERFLVAIATSPTRYAWKQKGNPILVGFDLELVELPPDKIEVMEPGERLNLSLAKEFLIMGNALMSVQEKYETVLRELSVLKAEVAELKNRG